MFNKECICWWKEFWHFPVQRLTVQTATVFGLQCYVSECMPYFCFSKNHHRIKSDNDSAHFCPSHMGSSEGKDIHFYTQTISLTLTEVSYNALLTTRLQIAPSHEVFRVKFCKHFPSLPWWLLASPMWPSLIWSFWYLVKSAF
jgi:hypothetical protein